MKMGNRPLKSIVCVTALLAVLSISLWTFLKYHHRTPDVASIDGTYISPCCDEIHIKSGVAHYDGDRAHIKLVFDKFGLVGRLDRPLGPFFVVNDGVRAPVSFVFSNPEEFST